MLCAIKRSSNSIKEKRIILLRHNVKHWNDNMWKENSQYFLWDATTQKFIGPKLPHKNWLAVPTPKENRETFIYLGHRIKHNSFKWIEWKTGNQIMNCHRVQETNSYFAIGKMRSVFQLRLSDFVRFPKFCLICSLNIFCR